MYRIRYRWPSVLEWAAIMRGLSAALRLDSRFTLLEHLIGMVQRANRIERIYAVEFVLDAIASHTFMLGLEIGLAQNHARTIATDVYNWLGDLALHSGAGPAFSLTANQWRALDLAAAERAYLPVGRTISTTLADARSFYWGISQQLAMHQIHALIARRAYLLAIDLGFPPRGAAKIQRKLEAALNCFD